MLKLRSNPKYHPPPLRIFKLISNVQCTMYIPRLCYPEGRESRWTWHQTLLCSAFLPQCCKPPLNTVSQKFLQPKGSGPWQNLNSFKAKKINLNTWLGDNLSSSFFLIIFKFLFSKFLHSTRSHYFFHILLFIVLFAVTIICYKLRAENANDSLNLSEVIDVRHNISLNITDSSINADEDKSSVEEPEA